MSALLRGLVAVSLLVVGVLAVVGVTPNIPQSIVIVGFFFVGSVALITWGHRKRVRS